MNTQVRRILQDAEDAAEILHKELARLRQALDSAAGDEDASDADTPREHRWLLFNRDTWTRCQTSDRRTVGCDKQYVAEAFQKGAGHRPTTETCSNTWISSRGTGRTVATHPA